MVVQTAANFPFVLHENFIEMSPPMPEGPHGLNPAKPDFGSENRPEAVLAEPHRLTGDIDAPPMRRILDVPRRKRSSDMHHYGGSDDLGNTLK